MGEDAADGSVGLTGSTGNEHGYGGDGEIGSQKAYQQRAGKQEKSDNLEASFQDPLRVSDDGGRRYQASYSGKRYEGSHPLGSAFYQFLGEHRQHREVGEGQNHGRDHEGDKELQSGVCGHVGEGFFHPCVGGGGSLAGTLGFRLAES